MSSVCFYDLIFRFRVTKVESKSKEQKRLMSEREASKDDVLATPVSVDTRQRNGPETEVSRLKGCFCVKNVLL